MQMIEKIRKAITGHISPVGIAIDIAGPEVRLGKLKPVCIHISVIFIILIFAIPFISYSKSILRMTFMTVIASTIFYVYK